MGSRAQFLANQPNSFFLDHIRALELIPEKESGNEAHSKQTTSEILNRNEGNIDVETVDIVVEDLTNGSRLTNFTSPNNHCETVVSDIVHDNVLRNGHKSPI